MSDTNPTPQDRERFMQYVGKRAVFRETGVLIPVTIEEILFEPHFEAKLTAVDGIVLCYSEQRPKGPAVFTVGAAWGYLKVQPHSWSFAISGCVWRVILEEAACDAVVRLCKEKTGLDPDVLFCLADLVSTNPDIEDIPDTVAELEGRIMESRRRKNAR